MAGGAATRRTGPARKQFPTAQARGIIASRLPMHASAA
jgi:hypothetical protein